MPLRLISEPLAPVTETIDFGCQPPGAPGLPQVFVWRGRRLEIEALLRTWRTTGPCRHGSPERYVRRHWYEVRAVGGEILKIYFERQGRPRGRHRWWLHSLLGP